MEVLAQELHKGARRRYPTRRVVVSGIDHQWQADLVDMHQCKKMNKGYSYILTIINILSKYAWAVALKTKNGPDTAAAFELIFKQGRVPHLLQTDAGKEFINKHMNTLLTKNDVNLFHTHSQRKASVVERFNRTLKERMWIKFTENNSNTYIHLLPKLIEEYNNTPHSSIGCKPSEVNKENEQQVWQTLYGNLQSQQTKASTKFKVGDAV